MSGTLAHAERGAAIAEHLLGRLVDGVARAGASAREASWPITLTFRDRTVERRYQDAMGQVGLAGYRLSCLMGALLWLTAMLVVPVPDPSESPRTIIVGSMGVALNLLGLAASRWTRTLDRQNAVATPIAIANGGGALMLASALGVMEARGASALMLIAVFFFVARVRFIFATIRVAALLALFGLTAALSPDPRSLVLDTFILIAAMAGVLLGLYRMELGSRRLFRTEQTIVTQADALRRENAEAQHLLLSILPASVARRLRNGEEGIADEVPDATVLFADLAGFTALGHEMPPAELVRHLDTLFSRFDEAAEQAGIEKIKTIGDAYMAVGGVPEPLPGHTQRVVDLGLTMIDIVRAYARDTGLPLALRVGVHTGPMVAGVIGTHKFQYDLWGDTVNTASRLEAAGVPGYVQVSAAVRERLGSDLRSRFRGLVPLKGLGPVATWLVGPDTRGGAGPGSSRPSASEPGRAG
jgi:class 3 adenylate cyclase